MNSNLIACAATLGTVAPCSCKVLHDDSYLEPDFIQVNTCKLCNMYINWYGEIAVPASVFF